MSELHTLVQVFNVGTPILSVLFSLTYDQKIGWKLEMKNFVLFMYCVLSIQSLFSVLIGLPMAGCESGEPVCCVYYLI